MWVRFSIFVSEISWLSSSLHLSFFSQIFASSVTLEMLRRRSVRSSRFTMSIRILLDFFLLSRVPFHLFSNTLFAALEFFPYGGRVCTTRRFPISSASSRFFSRVGFRGLIVGTAFRSTAPRIIPRIFLFPRRSTSLISYRPTIKSRPDRSRYFAKNRFLISP